jgi:hypothetical protein
MPGIVFTALDDAAGSNMGTGWHEMTVASYV